MARIVTVIKWGGQLRRISPTISAEQHGPMAKKSPSAHATYGHNISHFMLFSSLTPRFFISFIYVCVLHLHKDNKHVPRVLQIRNLLRFFPPT